MDRVNDVAILKPEQVAITSVGAAPAVLPRLEGRIEFRNTCFRYGGEDTPMILNNFNLVIEPGQSVAFVGPSGCGKSTAIKMIMGFNMPTGGECLVDGKDITVVDLTSYRRQIGVVLQDSFLFSDTVAGNIALGDTEPDMNAVREAARLSSADDFIARLQQGYQTPLGEKGIQVSGGQRQRICIARALYRRPKILIFDEATSALDNESEARIQQNMKQILTGKTSIAIAHRLSTVRDCDFICFMENGVVQEKGTHDELVALKGRYYELAKKPVRPGVNAGGCALAAGGCIRQSSPDGGWNVARQGVGATHVQCSGKTDRPKRACEGPGDSLFGPGHLRPRSDLEFVPDQPSVDFPKARPHLSGRQRLVRGGPGQQQRDVSERGPNPEGAAQGR